MPLIPPRSIQTLKILSSRWRYGHTLLFNLHVLYNTAWNNDTFFLAGRRNETHKVLSSLFFFPRRSGLCLVTSATPMVVSRVLIVRCLPFYVVFHFAGISLQQWDQAVRLLILLSAPLSLALCLCVCLCIQPHQLSTQLTLSRKSVFFRLLFSPNHYNLRLLRSDLYPHAYYSSCFFFFNLFLLHLSFHHARVMFHFSPPSPSRFFTRYCSPCLSRRSFVSFLSSSPLWKTIFVSRLPLLALPFYSRCPLFLFF